MRWHRVTSPHDLPGYMGPTWAAGDGRNVQAVMYVRDHGGFFQLDSVWCFSGPAQMGWSTSFNVAVLRAEALIADALMAGHPAGSVRWPEWLTFQYRHSEYLERQAVGG